MGKRTTAAAVEQPPSKYASNLAGLWFARNDLRDYREAYDRLCRVGEARITRELILKIEALQREVIKYLVPCTSCPRTVIVEVTVGDPDQAEPRTATCDLCAAEKCPAAGCVIKPGAHSPASNEPGGPDYHESADGRTWKE